MEERITLTKQFQLNGGASSSANLREVYILRGTERIPVNIKKIAQVDYQMSFWSKEINFLSKSLYSDLFPIVIRRPVLDVRYCLCVAKSQVWL